MSSHAKELFDTSVDQVRRGELRPALNTLLDALAVDPVHGPSLEACGRICRIMGAPDDGRLFEEVAEHPDAPEALFDLAHRLVEQTRPDVACGLLQLAMKTLGEEPGITALRRELAYAQLMDRDFTGSLKTLARVETQLADLADPEILDVHLMQAEAALYTGRRDLSEHFLAQADELVPDDDHRAQLDALHALLGRSRHWPNLAEAGLREWHFIQHAGVILKTAGGWFEDGSRGGRFEFLDLRLDMVAFLMRRLLDLLEELQLSSEIIVPASETSAPMAHALGQQWDRPVVKDLTERHGRPALLVATNAGEFAPILAGLVGHRSDLRTFALNLDWGLDAPVCPEIVGILARRALVPWETHYAIDGDSRQMREIPGDDRPAATIGAELAHAMDNLLDDGGKARDEFLDFYRPLAGELVLGNEDIHPFRRQFTRLSPSWKPTSPERVQLD